MFQQDNMILHGATAQDARKGNLNDHVESSCSRTVPGKIASNRSLIDYILLKLERADRFLRTAAIDFARGFVCSSAVPVVQL